MSALQKKGATITTKADEMDRLSTAARNDYLLSLAMANAHQRDFYNKQVSLELEVTQVSHHQMM